MEIRALILAVALTMVVVALPGQSGAAEAAGRADVPTVDAHVFGDADCNGAVDARDAMQVLRSIAALPVSGCLELGNTDCGQQIGVLDALDIILFAAGLPVLNGECPQLGAPATVLSSPVAAGATELAVADLSGFSVGDFVRIAPGGPNQEDNQIAFFGSMGLEHPLEFSHGTGAYVVKKPPPVPEAPTGVTATAVDAHNIKIEWNDNSAYEGGFEVSDAERPSYLVGPNVETYTVSGLEPGTYRCYHVRSYNVVGHSAWAPAELPYYACATTPDS